MSHKKRHKYVEGVCKFCGLKQSERLETLRTHREWRELGRPVSGQPAGNSHTRRLFLRALKRELAA